jgi:hypothetical protein
MEISKDKVKDMIDNMDNEKLKKIYQYSVKLNKNNKILILDNVKTKKEIDHSTPKYKVGLNFVNKILNNLGEKQLDNLRNFQNVDRLDIIKDINKQTFEAMENELYKHFDKNKCGWYRRKTTKNIILTFLRGMCEELGFVFSYVPKNKTKDMKVETHFYYSIK